MVRDLWREWLVNTFNLRYTIAYIAIFGGMFIYGDLISEDINTVGRGIGDVIEMVIPVPDLPIPEELGVLLSDHSVLDTSRVMRI